MTKQATKFVVTFSDKSYSDPVTIDEIAKWSDVSDIERIDVYREESDRDRLTEAMERRYDD